MTTQSERDKFLRTLTPLTVDDLVRYAKISGLNEQLRDALDRQDAAAHTEIDMWVQVGMTDTYTWTWWCRLCRIGMPSPIAGNVNLSAVHHVLGRDHVATSLLNAGNQHEGRIT